MSKKSSFLLTKWYLDCVSDSGDAAIAYVANLQWNQLCVHYGTLLTVCDGHVDCISTLRRCLLPQLSADTLTLALPHLGVSGTWRALRTTLQRTVFENKDGSIDWLCHQPMSEVDLQLHGKKPMSGLGYAECLTLSLRPWKLPLEELHWGRFLSRQHAVVWIDWRGPYQWRTVLHNGEEREIVSLSDSEMAFAASTTKLELDQGLVLRNGQLGHTVFAGISRLAKLLPRTMLSVEECKWRSRGVLYSEGAAHSGWAIHEVVRWR